MEQFKTCSVCLQILPLNNFQPRNKNSEHYFTYCKKCGYQKQVLWNRNNRERKAATSKRWHDKNRQVVNEKQRQRKRNQPEYYTNLANVRRARKQANGVFKILERELKAIRRQPCFYCNQLTKRMTLDHIIPISKGGRHSIGNLLPSCLPCNASKGNKLLIDYLQYRKNLYDVAAGQTDSVGKPGRS